MYKLAGSLMYSKRSVLAILLVCTALGCKATSGPIILWIPDLRPFVFGS